MVYQLIVPLELSRQNQEVAVYQRSSSSEGGGSSFISRVQVLSLPDGDIDCHRRRAGNSDDSMRLTMKVQGQFRLAPTHCGPENEGGRGRGNGDDYSLLRVKR